MTKKKIATVWLDGCSGCHMSFLDLDERLLKVLDLAEIVYSPLIDVKKFPDRVDVTLVEGAVSTKEDLEKIKMVRSRSSVLVSLGDCATTSNVPGMRNPFFVRDVLNRAYRENSGPGGEPPSETVPELLPNSRPIHEYVKVDVFVPGCPPSPDSIFLVVSDLLEGRTPELAGASHFGA